MHCLACAGAALLTAAVMHARMDARLCVHVNRGCKGEAEKLLRKKPAAEAGT